MNGIAMRIGVFLLKRAAQLVLLSLLVAFVTFLLSSLIPGDFFSTHILDASVRTETVEQLRHAYGLDAPFYIQYLRWLKNLFRLDLGYSMFYQRPVLQVVADALAKTLWMGIPALVLGFGLGIIVGSAHGIAGQRPAGRLAGFSLVDHIVSAFAFVGIGCFAVRRSHALVPAGRHEFSGKPERRLWAVGHRPHPSPDPAGCLPHDPDFCVCRTHPIFGDKKRARRAFRSLRPVSRIEPFSHLLSIYRASRAESGSFDIGTDARGHPQRQSCSRSNFCVARSWPDHI